MRDESRTVGEADSISFPTSEDDVRDVLTPARRGRSGNGAGRAHGPCRGRRAHGGHVMNLSRMDRVLGLRQDDDGRFYVRVQPGVVYRQPAQAARGQVAAHRGLERQTWQPFDALYAGPEQFFPTDPTATSACIGSMVACNASGARSYGYGPVRPHVSALRVVLADGDVLSLARGQVRASGRTLRLSTEGGRELELHLPTYQMPRTKNASGYYVADDMDSLDLFRGYDGTLGV